MPVMTNKTVELTLGSGVATVRLDRPDTLNAMNNDLMDDLRSAIEQSEADPSIGVVVITGTGRGFCAGADLNTVGPERNAESGGGTGVAVTDGMDHHFNPTMRAIKNCAVPTVARINGVAAGGGLGLALSCDIAVAAESAFFVATFGPRLGIVPDLGTTWSLPHKIGVARARSMAMLGDRITAEQALAWGMIYSVVPDAELDAEIERVTTTLKVTSGEAMQRIRTSIESASTRSFSEQLDVERDHQAVLIPMNMHEGATAFLEKREPNFR